MTPIEILALPMQQNDAEAATIRDYLKALLAEVWREEEGFSGKRPFGNSGWTHELMVPLVKAKVIGGDIDADGYVHGYNRSAGEKVIAKAIAAL